MTIPSVISNPDGTLELDPAQADPDNPLVSDLDSAQYDRENRPIISFAQYQQILARGGRVDGYGLRVRMHPDRCRELGIQHKPGVWSIQASKLLKWRRFGYVPIGEDAPPRPMKKDQVVSPEVKVYFCSERYPDCQRFFDNRRGLQWHWKRDHGDDN